MSKRRVVVTGLGAVTPIGNNVKDFWAGIRAGKVGIGPITKFDTTDYKVKIAAEVKDFNAKDHMDPRSARRMDPFCQYAVTAAKEALEDSGIDMEKEDSFRVGVIVGSGIGSLPQVENNYEKIITKGPGKVNPLMVPMMISNMAAGNTTRASIPFDKDRSGFVLGEGAGIVVLEELEHAKARGARIYAELVGYGATADAFHITSPAEDGAGAARAMELAMEEAGVQPSEVEYINAHGTSTHHNDLFETRAIHKAFGDAAKNLVVNSTKSMIGHLLGAAGGVEFVTCVKSLEDGFIHQTVGTTEPDEECDLNYAIGAPIDKEIRYAMSNSLGFGGHNATLLVKKYEG